MLAVAVARRAREDRHHDLRPEPPDHVQHVGQQRVARPEPKRFLGRLGVPEIERAGEELAGAVELASGEELLGADDSKLGAELRADQVLAALPARERQVGGLHAHATGQEREELRVLIVGVGETEEHTSELQSPCNLVCRLLLEKKKKIFLEELRLSKKVDDVL